jgi:hypothetical protein
MSTSPDPSTVTVRAGWVGWADVLDGVDLLAGGAPSRGAAVRDEATGTCVVDR